MRRATQFATLPRMSDQFLAKSDENSHPGRWKKGQSGNPHGRPKGWRSAIATLFDSAGMKDGPGVYAAIHQAALSGDMRAAELLMSRWWPLVKRTSLDLPDLPTLETPQDAVRAASHVMALAAQNEISAEQADIAMRLIEASRKTIEIADLDARLRALEERSAGS